MNPNAPSTEGRSTRVGFDIGEQCLVGLAINERVLEVDRQFRICLAANETDVSITNFISLPTLRHAIN
jgi:hypothetical protein